MGATRSREEEFRERLERLSGESARGRRRIRRRMDAVEEMSGAVERGGVLVVERRAEEIVSLDEAERLAARLKELRSSALTSVGTNVDLERVASNPSGALFVDTETTGLGGSMIFLLGSMRVTDAGIVLRQVFARDYREEPALLALWVEMLGSAEMLVSFNGKAFDLPVIRDRLGLHGLEVPPEPPHLDLLHVSRRRWSEALPDCRLQTLEWRVCGRRRAGDIPGQEIPAVYHRFVRTGLPDDILTVFHHNALDLITLGDLVVALAADSDPA